MWMLIPENTLRQLTRNWLKKAGPIPDNDVWIAALALQHGLRLFTKDNHFKEVDGLELLMP
jgi:predicted nucleic acid-binding protein